jgi:hypothetical protein
MFALNFDLLFEGLKRIRSKDVLFFFSKIIKKCKSYALSMHKISSYEIFDAYLCCTAIGSLVYFENVE